MNAELLSAIAGLVISLALSYIPGLADKWAGLDGTVKRAVMGILIMVVGLVSYAGTCQGWWGSGDCGNWQTLAASILAALIANQSIYQITKG
jgi:hypothetical protein